MSSKDQTDSLLRIVSNKCRNLRKAIDRARAQEAAEKRGEQLNDEQRESVRGLSRKEALLVELEEILKRQTAVLEPQQPETKPSRRALKAAKAKARERKGSSKSISEKSSEEGERNEKVPEAESGARPDGNDTAHPNGNGNPAEKNELFADATRAAERSAEQLAELEVLRKQSEKMSKEREALLKEMAELKLSHEQQLAQDKKKAVASTLNLFHVADFLRQPGSREALLSYYATPEGKMSPLVLNGLHLDPVCYFNVMLTSPNGNVPHPEAVDVSTAHCMEYLKGSTTDAFIGTSYAALVEIVDAIASCPILTDRGVPPEEVKQRNRGGRNRNRSKTGPQSSPESGATQPSPIVDNPVADRNVS